MLQLSVSNPAGLQHNVCCSFRLLWLTATCEFGTQLQQLDMEGGQGCIIHSDPLT